MTASPPPSPEGDRNPDAPSAVQGEQRGEHDAKPGAIREVAASRQVHLDVREDIRRGREPFVKIMAAVKRLGPDEVLVLRAPFEPIPLYDVLGKRGFAHWTEERDRDDWAVWFYAEVDGVAARRNEQDRVADLSRVIDVRGLEPPAPMVRVLEALERLRSGEQLEVLHERRPMFLYPQLDERGFTHDTDEPEPGLVRIVIRRGAAER
jgi:uncharacterized protein (DUF2249 family)